jgi:hypothetical protein
MGVFIFKFSSSFANPDGAAPHADTGQALALTVRRLTHLNPYRKNCQGLRRQIPYPDARKIKTSRPVFLFFQRRGFLKLDS